LEESRVMKPMHTAVENARFIAPIPTPLGHFLAVVDAAGALVALDFDERTSAHRKLPPDERRARKVIDAVQRYFSGELFEFHLDLAPEGTPFQLRVWQEPRRLGDPKAVRAVGGANGANPIAVVVPCHRVIGADGSLTGYGGGLERKRALLAHEARYSGKPVQLALT